MNQVDSSAPIERVKAFQNVVGLAGAGDCAPICASIRALSPCREGRSSPKPCFFGATEWLCADDRDRLTERNGLLTNHDDRHDIYLVKGGMLRVRSRNDIGT